jgi:hypothetical protein
MVLFSLNMLVQLIDRDGWKSPVLDIHNDHDLIASFIEDWKIQLTNWSASFPRGGPPLSRFDPNVAMCDLIYKLGRRFYSEEFGITGWFRLFNEADPAIDSRTAHIVTIQLN